MKLLCGRLKVLYRPLRLIKILTMFKTKNMTLECVKTKKICQSNIPGQYFSPVNGYTNYFVLQCSSPPWIVYTVTTRLLDAELLHYMQALYPIHPT